MSRVVKFFQSAAWACLLGGGATAYAAVGQSASRPGPVADNASFQSATRQQHQIGAADEQVADCEMSRIDDIVTLIYKRNDEQAALALARRCEIFSVTQARPDFRTLAARIKALVAIKSKDMTGLKAAGEALVKESLSPEFVADGHLFIAFACTFSGRPACARPHLDQAKTLFVRHDVSGAMEQVNSVEQALLKLESSPN
jgi:hypothetical protein